GGACSAPYGARSREITAFGASAARAATNCPITPRDGLRTAVMPVAAWRVARVLRTTSPSNPAMHTRSADRVRLIAATAGPIAVGVFTSMFTGTSGKLPSTSSSIASGSSPARRTAPASAALRASIRRGSPAMRSRSSSWTARARPSRGARVSVSSMSAPARGPGRHRERGARRRSLLLLSAESILLLLVLSTAARVHRAPGTMMCSAVAPPWCGAPRALALPRALRFLSGALGAVGAGRGASVDSILRAWRMFVSGGVGAGLSLLRGEVLELAAGAVDQRAGEEQREDPPLERVGQVRAERGVRGGQCGG